MSERELKIAHTEALFRDVNERIVASAKRFNSADADLVCECADSGCAERIHATLEEYEQVILLSTTSKQASLDLLGVKEDELHFIEFKKRGSQLQTPERKIKRLVDESKVKYVVKDVELPGRFEMDDRNPAGGSE